MKKYLFKSLSQINKKILPSLKHKDMTRLSKWEMILLGYRYYITTQYLEAKNQTDKNS
ncbi:MAG: hypothetical protein LAT68_01230 [Cyclobacteriaceae bacterium]|nr:hypothetical protein [Cyclobacteriaceae bacterium]MCH8514925.1 hypothetical protein [Cyclobacteriaceae bacterium]